MSIASPGSVPSGLSLPPADLSRAQRVALGLLVLVLHGGLALQVWRSQLAPIEEVKPAVITAHLVSETPRVAQPEVRRAEALPPPRAEPRRAPQVRSPQALRTPASPVLSSPQQARADDAQVVQRPVVQSPATAPAAAANVAASSAPQTVSEPSKVPAVQPAAPKELPSSAVRYKSKPALDYPMEARYLGESGTVHLRVLVDTEGVARQVKVVRGSGSASLDRQAVAFIRAARFYPYVEAGVAREFWVSTDIEFNLE